MGKIELSKSKIKSNENCELMLWHEINSPREEKVWDASTQFTFEQGREVEAVARSMFPNSVLQDKIKNWDKILYTKELLKTNKTIFEAAFASRNCIIQFDMLTPNGDGTYSATEIKSSGQFKPDYETDVIIQYWIATQAGIEITKFDLWYVNKKSTSIDDNYFVKHDVTELVKSSERKFWEMLHRAEKTLMLKKAPEVKAGAHCKKFDCAFRGTSQCKLSKSPDSVLSLPKFPNAFDAYHQGITSVNNEEFDKTYKYSEKYPLVVQSIRENRLVINKEGLMAEYSQWKFPLNLFDFEALMSAIPVLKGQTPYAQMVFQFSNHIYDGQSDRLNHVMYLHETLDNPNRGVIESMLNCLESNEGSIVAYNMPYEKSRINELAIKYPEYKERLERLNARFVDLMDLVKHHVYHPEFMGSYSLKKVSPALLKEYGSYTDSTIKSGAEIAKYYIEMLTTKDQARREEIKSALIKYSTYDTLNLFLVIKYLMDQSVDLKSLVELNT